MADATRQCTDTPTIQGIPRTGTQPRPRTLSPTSLAFAYAVHPSCVSLPVTQPLHPQSTTRRRPCSGDSADKSIPTSRGSFASIKSTYCSGQNTMLRHDYHYNSHVHVLRGMRARLECETWSHALIRTSSSKTPPLRMDVHM